MGNRFAAGRWAFGFCDICGQRYALGDLKKEVIKTKEVAIRACPECWSPDQPQLQLGMYPVDDPQALRDPRPDFSYPESRSYTEPPIGLGGSLFIGQVTIANAQLTADTTLFTADTTLLTADMTVYAP